jgi:hypothetical protein
MATPTELTFMAAVSAAEGTRQAAKVAAFTTYAFVPANLAAYKIALEDADVAYVTAVNAARNTADLQVGTLGINGPVPTAWASLTGML